MQRRSTRGRNPFRRISRRFADPCRSPTALATIRSPECQTAYLGTGDLWSMSKCEQQTRRSPSSKAIRQLPALPKAASICRAMSRRQLKALVHVLKWISFKGLAESLCSPCSRAKRAVNATTQILPPAGKSRTDSYRRRRCRCGQLRARICCRASTVRGKLPVHVSKSGPICPTRFVARCAVRS